MEKKNSFTTDAIILTGSKVLSNVLVLVSAMLLARIRTLEENGIYSELLLIINLATAIFMLGLPNSINFFLAKAESKEDKNRFLSLYYTLSTGLSCFIGVLLAVLTPVFILFFHDSELSQYVFFLLIFPWEKIILASIENVLVVLGKTKTLMFFRVSNGVFLLLIIYIIWIMKSSFMMYMVLYAVVEGSYAILVYYLAMKYTGRLHFNINRKLLKDLLVFSIPLGLASLVGTLNIEVDKLMIGYMLDTEEFAIYSNASKELPLTIFATSLTAVLMPKMVVLFKDRKNEEAVTLWRDATTVSFAIIAFFGFGLAFFSTDAITILYSAKYAPGNCVFAIYSLELLLKCTYFGIILNTTGKTKLVLYCTIGAFCVNIVLNFILYQIIGMAGPALATLLSGLTIAFLQLFLSSKQINVRFANIFPWKNIGVILLVNVILGGIFYTIHKKFFSENYQAVILAVVWGIAYLAILLKPAKNYWARLKTV